VSAGPRIVVLRFSALSAPKLRPWLEHVQRVTGAIPALAEGDHDGVLAWSLVSANNRELARSARIFSRFDAAVDDARACVRDHARLVAHLQSDDRSGGYGWRLGLDGTAELVCARWYTSDRDRRHAVTAAVQALPDAIVSAGARSAHPSLLATAGVVDG
jgi:hypothetical protein